MKRTMMESVGEDANVNERVKPAKRMNRSSSGDEFSKFDSLILHKIYTYLPSDDLSSQLALYSTSKNVMEFVKSENTIPLNAIFKLKDFIDENPNISRVTLHYRMIGLLNQYGWMNPIVPIDLSSYYVRDLPTTLSNHCKNGNIELIYAFKDPIYEGDFKYLEIALKKSNTDTCYTVKYTEIETMHGRSYENISFLDLTVDGTSVHDGTGITSPEMMVEINENALICKEFKAQQLFKDLFGISTKTSLNDDRYERFTALEFDRNDETLIDKFARDLFDLNNIDLFDAIVGLVEKTSYLCRSKLVGKEETADEHEEALKVVVETKDTEKIIEENTLFEFVSLLKHSANSSYLDEYTSTSYQSIVCKLRRNDNGEIFTVSLSAETGPSYAGQCLNFNLSINDELALSFTMDEGTADLIPQDCLKPFVQSFKTEFNYIDFVGELVEFIIESISDKWVVHSLYEMESDKAGLVQTTSAVSTLSEVLEYLLEQEVKDEEEDDQGE